MIRIYAILMILISQLITMNPSVAAAAESGWKEVGIRVGYQDGTREQYFRRYDVFAVYGLPFEWRASSGWGVDTNIETSAGALTGGGETGFIGAVGPGLSINKSGKGLALDIGISFNVMDRKKFVNQNFGSILLFGAGIGASYRFENGMKIRYQILHTSNGHILYPSGTPNPGLDSHVVGVSWNF